MDVFEDPVYRINKRYLLACGLWPHDKSKAMLIRRTVIFSFLSLVIIAQLLSFVTSGADMEYLAEVVPPALLFSIGVMKYATLWFNSRRFKNILDKITLDWGNLDAEEMHIIKLYATRARSYGICYIAIAYVSMIGVILITISPRLLDIISPLNESRQIFFPAKLLYFVDKEDYPFLVQLHYFLCFFITLHIIIAPEIMSITILLHACGKFKIIGYLLEQFLDKYVTEMRGINGSYFAQNFISRVIKYHVGALEFVKLVNACYSTSYCIQFFISIIMVAINMFCAFQSFVVLNNLKKAVAFSINFGAIIVCIFMTLYPGQELINHSNIVHQKVCSGKWYEVAPHIQKMLMFVMLKSFKQSTLSTPGSLLHASLETYALILRSSMSYFMALYSIK